MPKLNESRFLVQHILHECKFRLNKSGSNSKQTWNHDKC